MSKPTWSDQGAPKAAAKTPDSNGYSGDVSPQDTWAALSEDAKAILIDVRTRAEWVFLGFADLSSLGKEVMLMEWQSFPQMDINPSFMQILSEQIIALSPSEEDAKERPLFFICRSGMRSRSAAIAMQRAGFKTCYNVADGFEGPLDDADHRGLLAGWKHDGLPWRQS